MGGDEVDEGETEGPAEQAGEEDEATDSLLAEDEAVRDIVKGAGVVYGGLVAQMALAFLAQRFAAVHLSISGFGGLTTGTALLNLGGLVAGLGLSSGLTRYLPRLDTEEKRPLARDAFLLTVPVGMFLAAVTVVYADFLAAEIFGDPSVAVSIRIFGATIPFAAVMNLAIGGIRGQKISRYRVYVRNLLHPSLRFSLIIVAVLLGATQAGFAFAYALPFVVGALLSAVLFERTLPDQERSSSDRERLVEVVRYSLPLTVSKLASFAYRSIDIFLLLYFLGSTAVGIYGVAYAFAQLVGMFSTAFHYLGAPISSELESEDRMSEAIAVQSGVARWLTIASVTAIVPMILFASDLIEIIYRSGYARGGLALAILAVGFGVNNVLSLHSPLVQALGRSKLSAVNTIVASVVNVALNLWLIPLYGITGAAIATTASYVVLGLLPMLEVKYLAGSTVVSRDVLAPFGLVIPIGVGAYLAAARLPATLGWIMGFGAAFAATYAVAIVVLVGFTRTEVMLIRSVQDRLGVDSVIVDGIMRRFS